MSSIFVSYRGAPAALVGISQISFLGDVRHLPPGHPIVRMTAFMALYAQLVLIGEMPVDYTDADAEHFARVALIDARYLVGGESDEVIAARFRVPAAEVASAREDPREGH